MLRGVDGSGTPGFDPPTMPPFPPLSAFLLSLPPLSLLLSPPPPGFTSTGYTKRLSRAARRVQASARHQVVRVLLSR